MFLLAWLRKISFLVLIQIFKSADEFRTPMNSSDERRKLFEPSIAIAPMNRMGTTQEIADACLFLCSSKATFCQGANLVSDSTTAWRRLPANKSRSLMADTQLINLLNLYRLCLRIVILSCSHRGSSRNVYGLTPCGASSGTLEDIDSQP